MHFDEEKHVPTVISKIVLDSLDAPPTSPHITAADREKWRKALEARWAEAYTLSAAWPEGLRILDVVGAEHGFKNPHTGRKMSLEGRRPAMVRGGV